MDKPKRYSDEVPYEKRRYWYFTLHGLGPGTIPKDLHVLESREGQNNKGTLGLYICLDGILNTSELKEFDLRELVPPEEEKSEIEKIEEFFKEKGFNPMIEDIWTEHFGRVHIILHGDWKHEHLRCKWLMEELGYQQEFENAQPSDEDFYIAEHVYVKNTR